MRFVHQRAVVIGDVKAGDGTSVWPGAVIRADLAPIRIGRDCSIQDNSVIHVEPGKPVAIGDNVIVGHGSLLHSCTIGDNVLVGIGSIVLDGCKIGSNVVIAAGTLLKPGTDVKSGSFVYQKTGELVIKKVEKKHLELADSIRKSYSELARKYAAGEMK